MRKGRYIETMDEIKERDSKGCRMIDKNLAFQIMLLYESELKDKLPNKEQIEKRLEDAKKDNNLEEIKFLETVLKYIEK